MLSHDDPRYGDPDFDDAGNPIPEYIGPKCVICGEMDPVYHTVEGETVCDYDYRTLPWCDYCEEKILDDPIIILIRDGSRLDYPVTDIFYLHPMGLGTTGHCLVEWLRNFNETSTKGAEVNYE
jgi:hypothetical protein